MLAIVAAFGVLLAPAATAFAQRTLISPVRGEAEVEITKPDTKVIKGEVVTIIFVKNIATAPIAGLKIEENWYDKGNNPIGGDVYRHRRPLMPNQVIKVQLTTPRRSSMNTNQYQFTHANGAIKTEVVPKLEETPPTS
jgi:hypothetical protein